MNRRIQQFIGVLLAVFTLSAAAALTAERDQPKVAVVVAGPAAEQPATVAKARKLAQNRGAQLRVTHTTFDQLGVTHLLAAQRYDEVLTIGVDRRTAIDPVIAHYPETRFVELSASAL